MYKTKKMEVEKEMTKEQKEFQQKLNIQNAYVEVLKNYHTDLLEKVKKAKNISESEIIEVIEELGLLN